MAKKKRRRDGFHSQDTISVSALAHDGIIGSNFLILAWGHDKSQLTQCIFDRAKLKVAHILEFLFLL